MPALVATRYNPDLKAKYDELHWRRRAGNVATTAIMRKLLITANVVATHLQPRQTVVHARTRVGHAVDTGKKVLLYTLHAGIS